MKVIVHEELQGFIIKPFGRFDDGDCMSLREALERGFKGYCRYILLDLKDLQNITATGQRLLLSYSGQLAALHRTLILYDVNLPVMAAFEASGLANVILITPSLQEAKALLSARKKA